MVGEVEVDGELADEADHAFAFEGGFYAGKLAAVGGDVLVRGESWKFKRFAHAESVADDGAFKFLAAEFLVAGFGVFRKILLVECDPG